MALPLPPNLPQPLARPLVATRRRLQLQEALETLAAGVVGAAATAAVGGYLWRLGVLSGRGLRFLMLGAAVGVVAAAVVGFGRRVSWPLVAAKLDRASQLHDRVGSALAFAAEPQPTPFMRAAIEDATRRSAALVAAKAAPFAWPRALPVAALSGAAAILILSLRFPSAEPVDLIVPVVPHLPVLTLSPELIDAEKAAIAELLKTAEDNQDPEAQKVAKELQALLQQLDAQELTRKEVFDQLADLEKRLQARDQELADIQAKLKLAGKAMGENKALAKVKEALAKEDLAKAKKELEALAKDAEKLAQERDKSKKPESVSDEKKRQDLAEALAKAAAAVSVKEDSPEDRQRKLERQEDQKRDAEEQKLKDEQRQLQKKLEKNPKDEEARRELDRNKRKLERLERQKKEQSEARRQLERLEREMQKAAEELRKQLSPEALEQLRKMAQEAGKMEQEMKKLGSGKQMKLQIAELKEVLRRAGQNGQGKDGKNGQPQAGDGKDKGKGRGQQLQDFNQRANGDGEKTLVLGGQGDKDGPSVLLPLPGGGGDKPGDKPGGGGDKPGDKPGGGDEAGTDHDPNMMGRQTSLPSHKVDTRVAGKDGDGPTKSETISSSAGKGFATRGYKKVYGEYSSVVEEVMTKERVPPGYRFYVKRYFQLIKPRE